MKIAKKGWGTTVIAGSMAMTVLGLAASAQAESYKATFYIAGMGGHFAKAVCEIDPALPQPITVKELTKIDIGTNSTHPVHDARIDVNDRDTMFWSTYKVDKAAGGMHIGKVDLKTEKKVADSVVKLPPEATISSSIYCASAQTADYFLPISMTNKGFVDVFKKSDLSQVQRVFLEGTEGDIGKPYKFFHGVNSPDMKELLLTINEADKDHGTNIGKMHLLVLDMDAAVKGKVKVLRKGLATGSADGGFTSFRQYFSPNGKLIANSAGNSMLLIDAKSLEVLDHQAMGNLEENHDAIFTPDSKYVIATSRSKAVLPDCANPEKPGPNEFVMDGMLKLYDVAAKKFVGESTSVCATCHKQEGVGEHAVLCGLDANWSK